MKLARCIAMASLFVPAACDLLEPDDRSPEEGTYDVVLLFTSSTRRGPCIFPETGYCYTVDTVDVIREAIFEMTNVKADGGGRTFDATLTFNGLTYSEPGPLAGTPQLGSSGAFDIPSLSIAGGIFSVEMTGTVTSAGVLDGSITAHYGIMGSSTGTFTGVKRTGQAALARR